MGDILSSTFCDNGGYDLYEHPLNERMRLFMRLESLFKQMTTFKIATEYYSIKYFFDALFDILDFFHRYEIRSEILKEIQRLQIIFERRKNPDDEPLMNQLRIYLKIIHEINLNQIASLRENELFNSLRQRNFTQSGHSLFEVPAYQFWLGRTSKQKICFLSNCHDLFVHFSEAVTIILKVIRQNDVYESIDSKEGMYLKSLDRNKLNQMLRIHMPNESEYFPRVSGDTHRFAIRFMRQDDPAKRAVQINQPVRFSLQICAI